MIGDQLARGPQLACEHARRLREPVELVLVAQVPVDADYQRPVVHLELRVRSRPELGERLARGVRQEAAEQSRIRRLARQQRPVVERPVAEVVAVMRNEPRLGPVVDRELLQCRLGDQDGRDGGRDPDARRKWVAGCVGRAPQVRRDIHRQVEERDQAAEDVPHAQLATGRLVHQAVQPSGIDDAAIGRDGEREHVVEHDPLLAAWQRPAQHVELQLLVERQRCEEPGGVAAPEHVEAAPRRIGRQVGVRPPAPCVGDVRPCERAVPRQTRSRGINHLGWGRGSAGVPPASVRPPA